MAKEIIEKTFELNITNQLLDISNSYVHFMTNEYISKIKTENEWFDFFLSNRTFFAGGLSQLQESNTETGGYDVSIDYIDGNNQESRLLFLQYKSGEHADFCIDKESQFHGNRFDKKPHVIFKFNDAADNTQHSTLRKLANKKEIISESVLYVFPRITKKVEFGKKIKSLLNHTSFVPVLEIDKQAKEQTPPIEIIDGVSHNYRTSYEGTKSEVNYFYYFFLYNDLILSELVSELICIQFQRLFENYIKKYLKFTPEIEQLIDAIIESINNHSGIYKDLFIYKNLIIDYLNKFEIKSLNINDFDIPSAPQKYSTIISKNGLNLSFEKEIDLSSITYQII